MKRISTFLSIFSSLFLFSVSLKAQTDWPKITQTDDGSQLKMYQWEPESLDGSTLKARAALALQEKNKTDLVFGVVLLEASVENTGQQVVVRNSQITALKIPGITDEQSLGNIQAVLEEGLRQWNISFSSSDIQQKLSLKSKEQSLAAGIKNNPPKVIYTSRPSLLVYIDGDPILQRNSDWGMEAVINTPFTIVKNSNDRFYLYGNGNWYVASSATGPYSYTKNVPRNLDKIENSIKAKAEDKKFESGYSEDNTIRDIVVSTTPAELIQSNGEANFSPISGTGLLYVSNSPNDIFMDINSQQYYVLLAGRWYRSKNLRGDWQYISSDKLPADFAKIPDGSVKDNVLASVAGTGAADEALLDAQVPQTAKVDRRNSKADITYDGDPRFQDIEGTDMDYAINSPSSVIRWRGRYYAVDDGVWYESYSALGPWMVCTVRPWAVSLIPPDYPVYNMKYVYIYDVYPDYVYMGYTPGYLGTYIYGPTIVYGTGYYYRPWRHHYYYPGPCTWGWGMRYNPWYGWGFGINLNLGWFNFGFGNYYNYYPSWYGGWWGPRMYRPNWCWNDYRYGGYYGRYGIRNNTYIVNNYYYNNNIYNNRRGINTYDYRREGRGFRQGDYGRRDGGANVNNTVRYERDRAANFNNYNRNDNRNTGWSNNFRNNGRNQVENDRINRNSNITNDTRFSERNQNRGLNRNYNGNTRDRNFNNDNRVNNDTRFSERNGNRGFNRNNNDNNENRNFNDNRVNNDTRFSERNANRDQNRNPGQNPTRDFRPFDGQRPTREVQRRENFDLNNRNYNPGNGNRERQFGGGGNNRPPQVENRNFRSQEPSPRQQRPSYSGPSGGGENRGGGGNRGGGNGSGNRGRRG